MMRIPLVRCYVLKRGGEPQNRSLRYIPFLEFELWRYLMNSKHNFLVLDEEESTWVDEEEYDKYRGLLDRHSLEVVFQVRLLKYLERSKMLAPVERYFPEQDYEMRKRVFVTHYKDALDLGRRMNHTNLIQEMKGYWIKRDPKKP